jgi:hypothetical protein
MVIFLILYLILVTFFVIFSMFLVYHAVRFGVATMTNVLTIFLYLAVALAILLISYDYIGTIDWTMAIQLL